MSEELTLNLLLVEDDSDSINLTQMLLSYGDLLVDLTVATTLGEGLSYLNDNSFDLIVTDLNLPASKGLDTLYSILAAEQDSPVIVLTATKGEELGIQAIQAGAEDYLVKDATYAKRLVRSISYAIERKKLQVELHNQERRWRQILSSGPAVVYSCEPSGDFSATFISGSITEQLGYTVEEFLGEPGFWANRIHPADRDAVYSGLENLFKTDSYLHEYRFLAKDGNYRWMRDELKLIRDDQGEPVEILGNWIDISANKRMEEKIRQVYKMTALGELAAGIAHNCNNMLQPILGMGERLMRSIPKDTQSSEEIELVVAAAKNAAELVAQITAFAQQREAITEKADAYRFVDQALNLARAVLPTSIVLEEDLDEDSGTIIIDPSLISNAIFNILTNALDAIGDMNGTISISLSRINVDAELAATIADLQIGEYAKLSITDTGCGMEAELIDRIFEPFFTTKSEKEGVGLGLSTSYGIIATHSGCIHVSSTPNQGSTFDIYLPLASDEASN